MAPSMESGLVEPSLGIVLELDGVLADLHRVGYRESFNAAFKEMELDCADWSDTIYADLLRRGGSDEAMVRIFFEKIGWPLVVPTLGQDKFVKNVITRKRRALERMAAAGDLAPRPGLSEFVDEAVSSGAPMAVIGAFTRAGETVARLLVSQLGPDRERHLPVVGEADVASSMYQQVVSSNEVSPSDDAPSVASQAALAVAAQKQRLATEVAAILNSGRGLKVGVELNTGLSSSSQTDEVAALRTAVEMLSVPLQSCLLLAGGKAGLQTASLTQMPCVVVKSSQTSRAEFRGALSVYESFGGGGDLTVARLQRLMARLAKQD